MNKNKINFKIQDIEIEAQIDKTTYLKKNIIFILSLLVTPIIFYLFQNNKINLQTTILLSTTTITFLSLILFFEKKEDKNKEYKFDGIVNNDKNKEYFIHMGYLVKEHTLKGAAADFKKKGNVIAPILIDKTIYSTHVSISGTTGSGKTVMVKSLMKQLIMDIGTGFIFIEGKGDNGMLQEIYSEVVLAKREHDFYVLNFLDKNNSNTLNPLELGDYESVKDLLLDFINTGTQDTWEKGGLELLEAVLRVLIYLRDADLVWNTKYTKEINTVADIRKYKDVASIPVLKDIVNSPNSIFEFALAISRVYKNSNIEFESCLKTNNIKKEELEVFDIETEKELIHQGLIDVLLNQGNGVPDWEKIIEYGNYDTLLKNIETKDPMYKISVSTSFYGKLFQTFIGQYGEIFAVREGDVNLQDIMNNGKILYVLLQGINPTTASSIGKFILSLIRMVAKNRAKENPYPFPYTIFLDEFNSWSKGVEGFGDLMSVTRSYGLSFFVMGQSSLNKIDDGKGLEKEQILANTNINFFLKLQSKEIAKDLIETLPKKKILRKRLKSSSNTKDGERVDVDYDEKEEDYLKPNDLVGLKSGQGYIMIQGEIYRMITSYIPDTTRWDTDQRTNIPIIKMVKNDLKISSIKYF